MAMRSTIRLAVICAALALAMTAMPAAADDVAQAGRQVVEKWQGAVVTVQMVIKSSYSYGGEEGRKREDKSEVTGVVIDPSGLVALSLSATSPGEAFADMMPDDPEGKFQFSSELSDVKILLLDGQEIPANVVLRDKDLDLAFMRPKEKPAKPLAYVDLTKAAKPALLDQFIALYRLGTVASRSLAACVDRVQSVVEKPRTFYVPGAESMSVSVGAPVFALDASPIGVLLLRTRAGGGDEGSMFGGMSGMGMTYVVLPASDILEAAKQAGEGEAPK